MEAAGDGAQFSQKVEHIFHTGLWEPQERQHPPQNWTQSPRGCGGNLETFLMVNVAERDVVSNPLMFSLLAVLSEDIFAEGKGIFTKMRALS